VPQASAAIHLPIFDAGRLKARYGAARDVAMQASTRAQIEAQRTQRLLEVDAARQLRDSVVRRNLEAR
jgi:outer membrane protein TolC